MSCEKTHFKEWVALFHIKYIKFTAKLNLERCVSFSDGFR
jgi:hypothetical protein